MNDIIMQAIASPWLYLAMFVTAVIDGFFPPIPSETVLVAAAAVAASTGSTNLVLLCAVAAIGAAIGDNIAFAIGRAVGVRRFRWMRRPRVAASFDWASCTLDRSGTGLILGARFIPVGRVAVNMTAGALGYPPAPLRSSEYRRWLTVGHVLGGDRSRRRQPGERQADSRCSDRNRACSAPGVRD